MTTPEKQILPKKQPGLTRFGKFAIDQVLPFALLGHGAKKNPRGPDGNPLPGAKRPYLGHLVWMTSLRYQLFATKGTKCVKCGLEGQFFALERHPGDSHQNDSPHFNLYGIDANGEEVLLTKDHIIPKSRGGPDKLDNLQTMCYSCNWQKSNSQES